MAAQELGDQRQYSRYILPANGFAVNDFVETFAEFIKNASNSAVYPRYYRGTILRLTRNWAGIADAIMVTGKWFPPRDGGS